jgi:hypothetical protein
MAFSAKSFSMILVCSNCVWSSTSTFLRCITPTRT